MNGCVIPGTSIAVDFWQTRSHSQSGIKLFFLTHLHGDHVVGLTSTWRQPIYCSPITAQLLMKRYGLPHSIVRSLDVGQSHLISYCQGNCAQSTLSNQEKESRCNGLFKPNLEKHRCDLMSVTVIDANHCPGSVMFLFEGPFGKILHTGDFRFSPEMFEEGSLLSKHIGTIDIVYLDNTYCSPRCAFPSRHEALKEIVDIVKSHSNHDIVFGVRSLGKEELLAAVALAIEEWINVPPSTMTFVQSLGFPHVFQTGNSDARLRIVPFNTVSSEYVRRLNLRKPTIIILPTALYQGICGKPYCNTPEVFVIPYSDHSSYPELLQFVSTLRPACVKPIVQEKVRGPFGVDLSCRVDMNCFQQYLTEPQSVQPANQSCNRSSMHFSSASSSCGFKDLFPDFKGLLKRKHSIKKRNPKTSCPKGVNYFFEDETGEVSPQGKRAKTKNCKVLYTQNSIAPYEQNIQCEQDVNAQHGHGNQEQNSYSQQNDENYTTCMVLDTQKKTADVCNQTCENIYFEASQEEVRLQTVVEKHTASLQSESGTDVESMNSPQSKSNREHICSQVKIASCTSSPHLYDLVENLYKNVCTSTSTLKSTPVKMKIHREKRPVAPFSSSVGAKSSQKSRAISGTVKRTALPARSTSSTELNVEPKSECTDSVHSCIQKYLVRTYNGKAVSGKQQRAKLMHTYNSIFG